MIAVYRYARFKTSIIYLFIYFLPHQHIEGKLQRMVEEEAPKQLIGWSVNDHGTRQEHRGNMNAHVCVVKLRARQRMSSQKATGLK